jgi:quinolinate synthase
MLYKITPQQKRLIYKIKNLKKEKNAICLVHNYQRPEIYEIADFIGDSFGLSREASKTDAKVIVFCGVRFMAESAKILNQEKRVLLPSLEAGCPLADMISVDDLKRLKTRHPEAAVVAYVNTSAEVKAECDVCCTSANALKVVNSLPQNEIIFVPDYNMAKWVQMHTKKKIIAWKGDCYVHSRILYEKIAGAKKAHPEAKILAHPECSMDILKIADAVLGTEGMLKYASESESREFVIATEEGMVYKLQKELPDKKFYSAGGICFNQKKIHLEDVYDSLKKGQYEIEVSSDIMARARKALDKMLEMGRE